MCLLPVFPKYKNDAKVNKKVKIFNTIFRKLNPIFASQSNADDETLLDTYSPTGLSYDQLRPSLQGRPAGRLYGQPNFG